MKLFQIHRRQRLPLSIEEAWSFFSDPRNLQKITPPSLRFEVLSDLPERIYPGLLITYRIRPFLGIPLKWITEITHVVEPHLFIDEQRFGPYRFWQHRHQFRPIEGGVEVRDLVQYSLYGGPFVSVIDTIVVKKQLTSIFDYRREYLEKIFGSL